MKPALAVTTALLLVVAASAAAVVHVQHQNRRLFVESQELGREADRLSLEWNMLRLEEAAWTTHVRIEKVARERLNMRLPRREDVVIVRQ